MRQRISKRSDPIVAQFGRMWARNAANINHIPAARGSRKGVYILFDGSMPVYVGKGIVRQRIKSPQKGRKAEMWDRFSWYVLCDRKMMHDVESLMLKMLPEYLRSFNKQSGSFVDAKEVRQKDKNAIVITRIRKRRRRR